MKDKKMSKRNQKLCLELHFCKFIGSALYQIVITIIFKWCLQFL